MVGWEARSVDSINTRVESKFILSLDMEQLRKIIEAGCVGIVKDPSMVSEIATRSSKDVFLVTDFECPKYSFLMIFSRVKKRRNNYKSLGYYSEVVRQDQGASEDYSLDGIFSVKKNHEDIYESIYLWSNSASEAVILYNLGLRVWKKIISSRGNSPTVDSILSKLQRVSEKQNRDNLYLVRPEMKSLPYGKDVKVISLGSPESFDLVEEEMSYKIASRIAEVHRDMYLRHDSAFEEMHRVAKLFGLSLPTSPEEWENKSSSQ